MESCHKKKLQDYNYSIKINKGNEELFNIIIEGDGLYLYFKCCGSNGFLSEYKIEI